jgi:hypothetical protein
MSWHIEFSLVEKESYIMDKSEEHIVVISANDISLFHAYNECHLLVENLEDVCVYKSILDFYKRDKKFSQTYNCYYPILGGGSTTAMVLRHEMNAKHSLILCIVDSDKTFSTAPIKETPKKVQKEYEGNAAKYLTYLYILDKVMEVENLVPFQIYEEYCTPQADDKSKIELYANCQIIKKIKEKNEAYLDFFDFKKGIDSSHLINESVDNNNQQIVESVESLLIMPIEQNRERYRTIQEILSAKELAFTPQQKEKITKQIMHTETYIKGFGTDILKHIIESCEKSINTITKEQLTSTQRALYDEIGYILYNWTCACEPMRI